MRARGAMAVVVLGLAACVAPERPPMTGRVERVPFPGQAVNETYQLFVRLPPGYDTEPGRTFPLVVQLDANLPLFEEFEVTAGFASRLEAKGVLPPTIVVGIGYASGQVAAVQRNRDFGLPMENEVFRRTWGQLVPAAEAPRFYQLLRDELVPHLQRQYRVAGPKGRALFGHSMGGLFTLYALSQHDSGAPVFGAYVAASPSLYWDAGQLFGVWNRDFRAPTQPVTLFTAAGALEGPEMMGFFDEFTARVKAGAFAQLTFESRTLQTDHVGSCAPAFEQGLTFLAAHGFSGAP